MKSLKLFLAAGALLMLAACSNDPNLADQAKTATLTYTAATKGAAVVLKADLFPPNVESCIKAADQVAFNYEDSLNLTAQDWIKAGSADRKPLEDAFTNIQLLFNAATMNLTNALTGKGVC